METDPKLHSIDQVPQSLVAVEQPLVVLLENGPAFSVLIASHLSSEPGEGSIVLEDCTQFRIEEDGRHLIRKFEKVDFIFNTKTKFWIASPDQFETLFSQPSADPYAVVQLSRDQGVELDQLFSGTSQTTHIGERLHMIWDILRKRLATEPQFYSPSHFELRTPRFYADGRWNYPEPKRFL